MDISQAVIEKYLDGTISPEEFDTLVEWINADETHAAEFLRCTALHAHLHTYLESTAEQSLAPAYGKRLQRVFEVVSGPRTVSLLVAALVMGVLITAMAFMVPPFYRAVTQGDEEDPPQLIVAELTNVHRVVWTEPAGPGSHLVRGRRLELSAGLAEITFKSGAIALVEGPAHFVVQGNNRARLERGKLVARVEKQAAGFTIETPTATVIDVGTEFGVSVDDDGGTEISVFAGKVQLRPPCGNAEGIASRGETLTAGEARRVERRLDESAFASIGVKQSSLRFTRTIRERVQELVLAAALRPMLDNEQRHVGQVYFEDFERGCNGWGNRSENETWQRAGGVSGGFFQVQREELNPLFIPKSGSAAAGALGNLEEKFGPHIRISYYGRFNEGGSGPIRHVFQTGTQRWENRSLVAEVQPFQEDWQQVAFEIDTRWSDQQAQQYGWMQTHGEPISWSQTLQNVTRQEFFAGSNDTQRLNVGGIDNVRIETAAVGQQNAANSEGGAEEQSP